MTQVVNTALFKAVLERQEKAKKQSKKDKKGKDNRPITAEKGKAGVGKRDAPGKIKKNRKERRKEIRKATRKQNRLKDK